MENNCYRINIAKWLPISNSSAQSSSCAEMIELKNAIMKHMRNIIVIDNQIEDHIESNFQEPLNNLTMELEDIIKRYESVCATRGPSSDALQAVDDFKFNYLFSSTNRLLNVMAKFHYNFINKIIDDRNDGLIRSTFSIGKKRAEEHCHELIDCLLTIYRSSHEDNLKSPPSADEISENSSVEIYRALTKHMTPPHVKKLEVVPTDAVSQEKYIALKNIETIRALVMHQTKKIEQLIVASRDIMPPEFFHGHILKYNTQGQLETGKRALRKLLDQYREISWAAISGILDHVVLWWSSEGVAACNNHGVGAHDLQDWLHEFILRNGNNVPICVKLALLNLCDALGCHVTITCWDEIFRLSYIAAFESTASPFSTEGTNTGHMFVEMFQLLVNLNNKCEIGGEWMIGAPLMELALSEQIIILHRLDHSIHTMRLWASQESKLIAHTWQLENFFLIVKGDLNNCINELSYLKLADHTMALTTDCATSSVQVYVCARMRAKIVSEVNANILLLKKSSTSSIEILAKICRVVSMANLHMCLPPASYWNRSTSTTVTGDESLISPYVEKYLERVLLPVLEVLEDHEISNMVLTIMCEAWLDYIYLDQIKFNECGSYQLLRDFAHVSHWISECPIISQNMKEHLLKNEVLRRCEGVGRLLLRHPGEAIAMQKRGGTRDCEGNSPASLGLERMPAEMYVPNQEQWLELRAGRSFKFCRCTE